MATVEKVKENYFDEEWKNSDVIVEVGDQTLHLHANILSHYSPVFEVMLNENSNREIQLKGKQSNYVIQMFKFFYASLFPTISETTDFENLLPLFREYQLQWLIDASEKCLQKSKIDIIDKLYFAEQYDMKSLMNSILENSIDVTFQAMKSKKHWNDLSMRLKQKIAFKRLPNKSFWSGQNNSNHGNESWSSISFKVSQSLKGSKGLDFPFESSSSEIVKIRTFLKSEFDRLYEMIDNDEVSTT